MQSGGSVFLFCTRRSGECKKKKKKKRKILHYIREKEIVRMDRCC